MDAFSLDIYDEGMRAKIEGLQLRLAWEQLELGLTVITEWGNGSGADRGGDGTFRSAFHAGGGEQLGAS